MNAILMMIENVTGITRSTEFPFFAHDVHVPQPYQIVLPSGCSAVLCDTDGPAFVSAIREAGHEVGEHNGKERRVS